MLCQEEHRRAVLPEHTFVVCADTQYGMSSMNREWLTEAQYSRQAIQYINRLRPRPLFCCICGDLVHMTASIYAAEQGRSIPECDKIQDDQNIDFKNTWDKLHPDIALVCVCGNHDVGNRPTPSTIRRFRQAFGDDYLAWWANGTYNIAVNSSLFFDPSGAIEEYDKQLVWLEERLNYASENYASSIFVFGHHPWFLYRDDETPDDMAGESPYPLEWNMTGKVEPDSYFHIPIQYRRKVMDLFRKYSVSASFAGHFHQNLSSQSSFGMEMIATSSLSLVMHSTGIPKDFQEPQTRGVRVVTIRIESGNGSYTHTFTGL